MKVITNDRLIKRNARIGQIATFGSLIIVIGGLILTFKNPAYASLSWVSLIAGFALMQIGLYFQNRWGRHPRPDELVDKGLKGLNDQYSIYHYKAPASHLLVGPSGLWVIMPFYQGGKIVYEKNRYKQRGGGFMQKYLRLFGQEGLGRPELEAGAEVQAIDKFFKKNIPDVEIQEPSVALVFTNDNADLDVDNAPVLSIPIKELKSAVRKSAKEKSLSPELIKQINELFA